MFYLLIIIVDIINNEHPIQFRKLLKSTVSWCYFPLQIPYEKSHSP